MATTNTTIQIKKSGTTGTSPSALNYGELALNYYDGKLYYKNSSGNISYFYGANNGPGFATANANNNLILATTPNDTLSFLPDNGISITACTTSKTITVGGGSIYTAANNAANISTAAFIQANAAFAVANSAVYANTGGTITSVIYNRTAFTATAGQTVFTINYTVGYLQVFVNGVLLPTSDYTATNGTTFTLGVATNENDLVEAAAFNSGSYTRNTFIATSNQTLFYFTYVVGYVQIYINGILVPTTNFTATNGTSFTLSTGCTTGDVVDAITLTSISTVSVASVYDQSNATFIQANAAFGAANSAGVFANGAFVKANTASNTATSAYGAANGAYTQANNASNTATSAYGAANTASNTATSAYAQANGAFVQANNASNTATSAYGAANGAFVQANSASAYANAINLTQNTSITAAFIQANAAFIQANAVFTQSNTYVWPTANLAYAHANAAFVAANSAGGSSSAAAFTQANAAFIQANAAFSAANSAGGSASAAAFNQANAAFAQANAAFTKANTGTTSAGSAITYTRNAFTATGGQTDFTSTYTFGYLQVFVNGVLLSTSDYTATNGTSFTLNIAANTGDLVESAAFSSGSYTRNAFTATGGQTDFTSTYTVGQLQVYINGTFLATTDFTATNGTSFTLNIAAKDGDLVEAINITSNTSSNVTIGKSIAMAMIFGS